MRILEAARRAAIKRRDERRRGGASNPVVDTHPQLNQPRDVSETSPNLSLSDYIAEAKARPVTKIDYLIRNGLGTVAKLYYYRRAMLDPGASVRNPVYRQYVGEVLDKLLDVLLTDPTVFARLRWLLQKKPGQARGGTAMTPASEAQLGSLLRKSERSGCPIEVILEVFDRGLEDEAGDENKAFERVNSFIAGGLAADLDADLFEQLGEAVLPSQLPMKGPEPEHSPQYKDRVQREKDRKDRNATSRQIDRFLKNPSFGRPWADPKRRRLKESDQNDPVTHEHVENKYAIRLERVNRALRRTS